MPKTTGNQHGERSLWCSVILNTLEEAQGHVVGGANPTITSRITDSARDWLTRPNQDFNTVCYLAGLDPVAVRERAIKLLRSQNAG